MMFLSSVSHRWGFDQKTQVYTFAMKQFKDKNDA